jgi:hypothetical protein
MEVDQLMEETFVCHFDDKSFDWFAKYLDFTFGNKCVKDDGMEVG